MTEETQDQDIYVRAEGMTVVEFPVYREHIEARGHSVDMYVKVQKQPMPKDSKFMILRPRVVMHSPTVAVMFYETRPATIGQLMGKLYRDAGEPTELKASDADQEIIARLTDNLIDGYVSFVLNERAKERKWSSLDRLMAMINSTNTQWKAEAEFILEAYHGAHEHAQVLIGTLKSGEGIVPKNRQALDDILAIPTWPTDSSAEV